MSTPTGTEDRTGFYYVKGERVALERDPAGTFAVRLRRGVREDSPALSVSSRRLLGEDSEPVEFIAEYGLTVRRATREAPGEPGVARVRRLDAEDGVDLAMLAYRRGRTTDEVMFTTRRFVVQFRPDVGRDRVDALNAQYRVTLVEPAAYLVNGFVLEAPAGDGPTGPVALANTYVETGLALSATPDFVRRVHLKAAPAVPAAPAAVAARGGEFLGRQWHLDTARVVEAWDVTIGEPSIRVAILDDGVDVDHEEFAGKVVDQSDFASHVSDARPKAAEENHGTACAGVAVALGARAHGSAPGCSLIAVRTPQFLGVADEADMFRWAGDADADVISCSWGPADRTGSVDPLPDNVREAIRYCVTTGRGGKGIPIVWAAGNGDESVSLDGYAANPDVMAIAASTSDETRAHYSDFGPEIWVCAPSSGSAAKGQKRIFTTDRTGGDGYNVGGLSDGDAAGDYTNDFGGTSSATPLVAGVVGLMLSVNPALTHTQVREILRDTAEKIGDPADYGDSGHSTRFGFGRIDARRAVDAARAATAGGPTRGGTPSIVGPVRAARSDAPPVFTVRTGANPLFAVEIATRWQLLDGGAHDAERTPDTFYGSWADGRGPDLRGSSFALPREVWERLRHADRLHYRALTAQDGDWTGDERSTADRDAASAPYIEVTAGSVTAGTEPDATPTISGPPRWSRGGPAPSFTIDTAGRPLFAVELVSRPELFTADGADGRTPETAYGSWEDMLSQAASTFDLPAQAWQRLRGADRLYYRVHTGWDQDWTGGSLVSTPGDESASAPSTELTDAPETRTTRSRTESRVTARRGARDDGFGTVEFPLATFAEATETDDDLDYTDPVAGGLVPLIEVRDRLTESLSDNFAVHEIAARRLDVRGEHAAFARIAPELVEGLQAIRDMLDAPITVTSGYRYPALNDDVGGAGSSQHMTGRAADVKSPSASPLEIARVAIDVLGRDIGLGLGANIVHVDMRGEPASWVYEGAAMSEAEFDGWVRATRTELGRSAGAGGRPDSVERNRPTIVGPATVARAFPPSFEIRPGVYPFHAIELVDDWRRFAELGAPLAYDPEGTYASWRRGMTPSGTAPAAAVTVPAEAWKRLSGADRLYYRVVTSWAPDGTRFDDTSTALDRAEGAPSFRLFTDRSGRVDGRTTTTGTGSVRRSDEARWRDEPS